ncbi:MAG: CRP-like cAMP-binding protein [Candidatus Latescibacterota bacterium]|jgi:CRP-like cAMP-binding protein
MALELTKICPGSFLLEVREAGIEWLFNAWPDIVKYMVQQGRSFNGIVYPDLRRQTAKGTSANLIEFPLLYCLYNQGMVFRGEKPCVVGSPRQLELACESFLRGCYGFNSVEEMVDCDLSPEQAESLMREIEGLAFKGIQSARAQIELVELRPLEEMPGPESATQYRGVKIWKTGLNLFAVEYAGERVEVDCNLGPGEEYVPPLHIDVKNVPYKLFQIIDTGEEDGFSPKSCMHTVIQWRERIICVDLPMNASYLLDRVGISKTEIDAVIFTHNHDDHIGDLSLLMQMDRKVTVICPRIIWRSILLKVAAVFDMSMEALEDYFDYVPIRYGEEFDYAGLRILAHPSIHSVPCAIYRIRGIVDGEWKVYGHMSDILNFQRCEILVRSGHLTKRRFSEYKKFVLEKAAVKKIDVGARDGSEDISVHGSWRDFFADPSEHIVLAHTSADALDEHATVQVGQFAVAGSARDMGERSAHTYQDKYRERALKYLGDYLFSLLDERLEKGLIGRHQVRSYLRILADNEIRLIQPSTPFLKVGGESNFVDVVISGEGSIWDERNGSLQRVAVVQAGDVIGDMGVLLKVPRSATVRSNSYMNVLRIPAMLFWEIAVCLGIVDEESGRSEAVIEKIWRHREIVRYSGIFGAEVPVYLQNRLAQRSVEVRLAAGEELPTNDAEHFALFVGNNVEDFVVEIDGRVLDSQQVGVPVFGEGMILGRAVEEYRVVAQCQTIVLRLERDELDWIMRVPIFKLRLGQLVEERAIHVLRARKRAEIDGSP